MSNNSKVLALKYRPQVFKDLIGQDIIVETIEKSISQNKIPNAFLFTGIRGVGKTTIARILAKSLNCGNSEKNSCLKNKCKNCDEISESRHIDVLEMDAASKTGVDDVRDLIEFSRYGPTSSKFKIFIIDEVHMLSKQAFNALLKTLEEPPAYLKFIFATTEVNKIPVTVLSRCQRFDLSRIKSEELSEFLSKVAEMEKIDVNKDVLNLISKISEGSVRDALSLLDRVGIRDQAEKYPNQLSGGQQQRVAIARSLCTSPKIMLFDEPTSALDPEMISEVLDVMIELAKEGITMICVTHEMGFAKKVANRIIFMDDGQIVEENDPENFFNNAESDRLQQFLDQILTH